MSSSRRNSDKPSNSRRPRTRQERRPAEEGEFVSSEDYNQIQRDVEGELSIIPRFDSNSSEITERDQQEIEEEFHGIPNLVSDNSSDEEQCHQQQEDTMSHP